MASNSEGVTTTGAGDNQSAVESKGKGKAAASDIPEDTRMGDDAEDDDDDDEEDEEEAEEVGSPCSRRLNVFQPNSQRTKLTRQ